MNIILFSDNKNIPKCFTAIEKAKGFTLEYFPLSELKKQLKKPEPRSFIYVDISNNTAADIAKTAKFLAKQKGLCFGLIDSKGAVSDTAELFFNGASDYIGKGLFKEGIPVKRLKQAIDFKLPEAGSPPAADKIEETIQKTAAKKNASKANYILTGNSWKEIKPGKEYTFCFMFVELDNQAYIKKHLSGALLNDFTSAFHDILEETVAPINGQVWMWMDFCGLILLPFDGKKCDAIQTGFKLMLDRKIISFEDYPFNTLLSYRIALHIGNTLYKNRGNTGTIVSDSINSVFHLGQKYAKPNTFSLTEDVVEFIPEGLEEWFMPDAKFEGRNIIKMKGVL
ncbi:MAG: hypothetical protein GY754_14760 [bacterium]|nr:hypothetical protein [bacterium]